MIKIISQICCSIENVSSPPINLILEESNRPGLNQGNKYSLVGNKKLRCDYTFVWVLAQLEEEMQEG